MSPELLDILTSAASALAVFLSMHNKKAADSYKRGAEERHAALTSSLQEIAKQAAASIAAVSKPVEPVEPVEPVAEEPKAKRPRKVKDLTLAKAETPKPSEPVKPPAKPRRKPAKGAM